MASRTFKVHRVFPLGDYKNVQFSAELTSERDDLDVSPATIYDELLDDIYMAYFKHARVLDEMKNVKSIEDQQEVWNARNR